MFILRKLVPRHANPNHHEETNLIIGESYNMATTDQIEAMIAEDEYYKSIRDCIYGFIIYDNGSKVIPLYKGQKAYMMTDNGNTFANLSER